MKYVLFNPLSKNGNCKEKVTCFYGNPEFTVINVFDLENYESFINSLNSEDELHIYGGDGTLHHFVNHVRGYEIPCNIYFNTSGTGNDFYADVASSGDSDLILINEYIKNLPTAIINDKEYLFVNGVGFGIDGYCCEVADELQKKSDKPVNYASIAIKGLLFHFKPYNAKVTVDGVTKEYKKVWICPCMKGRYYGGGMNITPNQNRLNPEGIVSSGVFHSSGKFKTLMIFPKFFKGAHLKYTKNFEVREGKNIIVEFDRPCALQIDGETILGVTKYEIKA